MSEYQEEVLTSLLGLQAELRGDEPEPHDEHRGDASAEGSATTPGAEGQEVFAVTQQGITVSVPSGAAPDGGGVNERLAALQTRLAQLEYHLAGITKRIERLEPDADVQSPGHPVADVDERWRSFLDLQKIVADRLDQG